MIDVADLVHTGLYDPAAPNAADRLALLRWLEEHGLTLAEMAEARARGRLAVALGDRVIRFGERFDRAELAARTGLTPERIQQLRRAVSFGPVEPEARVYTEDDIRTFQGFEAGVALFGERATLQFARAMGSAVARLAETAVSLFLVNVEAPLAGRPSSEVALAKANLEAMQLLSLVPRYMESLFRVHIEEAMRRSQRARESTRTYDTSRLAVGFIDLVGFTPLSQQLSARELAALVDEFEGHAVDAAAERDGRVVKLIGDEVMFVAPTASIGCDIALTLADGFRGRRRVTPRGGVAFGEVLTRGGDYYGPIVNVAARIAELAVPHEVLVTADVRREAEAAAAPVGFAAAGRRMLKGFAKPVELFAATRT